MFYRRILFALSLILFPVFTIPRIPTRLFGQRPGISQLEHGRYLVEAVAICFECHSERDFSRPGWPIPAGRKGSGRILYGEGTKDQLVAPNISPDPMTGIGEWTNGEIIRAVKDGIGRDGHRLNPEMPYLYFSRMSEEDLKSVVEYLRSIPPVKNRLPKNPRYVEPASPPKVAMDSLKFIKSKEVERGEFLVRLGGCETCHTPADSSGYLPHMEFAGGSVFSHDKESAASSNLTPDPSGLAYYTKKTFVDTLRTGRVGARPLFSAMPWLFYRELSTEDLEAIFAYLRAIPPVSHRVDNTEPPTKCRLCRNEHGLGDKN
jgi:hypothetical protein